MSTNDRFSGAYQVDDGYVGNRPQHFTINAFELEDDMDDEALRCFYEESAEDHFRQSVGISCSRTDQFVEWAKAQLAARADTQTADLFAEGAKS
jgi:hypothetical protein